MKNQHAKYDSFQFLHTIGDFNETNS